MKASELQVGDEVLNVTGGSYPVEKMSVEVVEKPETVYNFHVEEFHTYYVGDSSVLVHNRCGGDSSTKPSQVHHYATDKSKTYTQSFRDITDKYGLDLDADWNKDLLPHQGRHPNAYHDFVLDEVRNIDNIANGNKDIFMDLYESEIKSIIRDNPDMLYSDYWKGIKE